MRPDATANTSDSGQSVLELAFSLPLFVLLLLGSAEIANIAWASVQVNNAARAGAAFAAQSHTYASDTTDISSAAKNEAPRLTNLEVTSSEVCTCVSNAGTAGTPDPGCTHTSIQTGSCPSPSTVQVAVQVNTSAVVTPLVHYPGLPSTYTIRAQATMEVEQ